MKRGGYEKFHNVHKGETGLAIGNGPGLVNVDLAALMNKYPSFGVNQFHFMYDMEKLAPTYYVSLGLYHLVTDDQRAPLLPMLDDNRVQAAFVNRLIAQRLPFDNVWGILGPGYYGHDNSKSRIFSFDPLNVIGTFCTVMYPVLQIAYYMGFQTILIVGMDQFYNPNADKHFYPDVEHTRLWGVTPTEKLDDDQLYDMTEAAMVLARKVYAQNGREIINLSEPTKCEVLERDDWRNWL